jgi:hypothetical protein
LPPGTRHRFPTFATAGDNFSRRVKTMLSSARCLLFSDH